MRSDDATLAICRTEAIRLARRITAAGFVRQYHPNRLNRGGDRRLNSALYSVALVRMGHNSGTRGYVTRRTRKVGPNAR